MQSNRLEAFSDGVLAIIITIMVLELKVPRGADLAALAPVAPVFASSAPSSLMRDGIRCWRRHWDGTGKASSRR
jgi:hypothetical protein